MRTQSNLLAEAGLYPEEIQQEAAELLADLRTARLREVRASQALTQNDPAQAAVSQIETGNMDEQ